MSDVASLKQHLKKYETLKKKYDNDLLQLKDNNDNSKMLNDQRITELESNLKETNDSYEMSMQSWDKEKAVL